MPEDADCECVVVVDVAVVAQLVPGAFRFHALVVKRLVYWFLFLFVAVF